MTAPGRLPEPYGRGDGGANLAGILERVLLLTVELRIVVASVDRAKEMGIDWWEDDPALSTRARRDELARENAELRERIARLELGRAKEEA